MYLNFSNDTTMLNKCKHSDQKFVLLSNSMCCKNKSHKEHLNFCTFFISTIIKNFASVGVNKASWKSGNIIKIILKYAKK